MYSNITYVTLSSQIEINYDIQLFLYIFVFYCTECIILNCTVKVIVAIKIFA